MTFRHRKSIAFPSFSHDTPWCLRLNAELISPSPYLPPFWRIVLPLLPSTIAQTGNLKDVTETFLSNIPCLSLNYAISLGSPSLLSPLWLSWLKLCNKTADKSCFPILDPYTSFTRIILKYQLIFKTFITRGDVQIQLIST